MNAKFFFDEIAARTFAYTTKCATIFEIGHKWLVIWMEKYNGI